MYRLARGVELLVDVTDMHRHVGVRLGDETDRLGLGLGLGIGLGLWLELRLGLGIGLGCDSKMNRIA